MLLRSLWQTLPRALEGFMWGAVIGLGLALLQSLVPTASATAQRFATVAHAVPVVVFAPILITMFGAVRVPVIVGAIAAFFPVFVALSNGLLQVPETPAAWFHTAGASRLTLMMHLQMPAAAPSLLNGLRIGAIGALLSEMFGEWFGTPGGLGVVLMNSWQESNVTLLWAGTVLATVLSLIVAAVFGAFVLMAGRRFK
ncbi:ABC transporter permease [Arthrobacter sp. KNU40]|uniref:ABC transporter permease n=1 Tax=Arthrobacter sp. KNU40 TaxID=3447965 RepID=UPI003F645328